MCVCVCVCVYLSVCLCVSIKDRKIARRAKHYFRSFAWSDVDLNLLFRIRTMASRLIQNADLNLRVISHDTSCENK